jgi:uncharacterized cupin superfamily protein
MPKVTMPPMTREADAQHPILGGGIGPFAWSVLGEAGGLTQFGVHLEILPPGSRSSFRHWHEAEDEMVMVLSGEVMLIEDTETPLGPGDVATWPAGQPVGHCLENSHNLDATYLVIGSRLARDVIHYPDHDLVTTKDGTGRSYAYADGRPRRRKEQE